MTSTGLNNLRNEINAILDVCSDYIEFFTITHADNIEWVEMVCNAMSSHRVSIFNEDAHARANTILNRQLEIQRDHQARV